MVLPNVTVSENVPPAFLGLGKWLLDSATAFVKAKALPGATGLSELEAAVAAGVPDLISLMTQISDIGPEFSASPISAIQGLMNPILDAVKVLTGKQ